MTTNEAANELSFVEVVHVEESVIRTGGHPGLSVCKLYIVDREEMVFRLVNRRNEILTRIIQIYSAIRFCDREELLFSE